MALHGTIEEGVVVGDIWDAWNERNISVGDLSEDRGWRKEEINTIHNYRGVKTRYSYPTLREISQLTSHFFEEVECHYQDYEMGDRCPTFFLKKLMPGK